VGCFICVLDSPLLAAAVALPPRLSRWMQVRQDYIANTHQLKAMETEVDYLEHVREALGSDPEFVARLAAASTADNTTDAGKIPVSRTLIFGSEEQIPERLPAGEPHVGIFLVQFLAGHRGLRAAMLILASLIVVFAFPVLNGSGGQLIAATRMSAATVARLPLARYRQTLPAGEETSSDAD